MATKIDFKLAPSFDIEVESHLFRQWHLMWKGFESLSGIPTIADDSTRETTRLQAFQQAVSKQTLWIVQHLPIVDHDDLDEILKALQNHIMGTTNEVFDRREFWRRTQQKSESFANYMLALRELSSWCNFGRCCDKCEAIQLRDRLTTGL